MMTRIDVRRFGLAWGVTAAVLYLGCVVVMAAAGKEALVFLFNSLFHGIDVSPILRMDVPTDQAVVGVLETFVIGWLTGAAIAGTYNFAQGRRNHD